MRCIAASDQSLLVRDCDALGVFHWLQRNPLSGVTGMSPSRTAVLIRFDARLLDHRAVEGWVTGCSADVGDRLTGRLVEIPTLYIGPDLAWVAEQSGLSTRDVVDIHSGCDYVAWFLGFMPGFAYLGDVPEQIAVPRRATPRNLVTPGSVGIGGSHTGIYPVACSGGWNLIGSTDLVLFDRASRKSLIEPGDRVRFIPL